MVASTDSKCTLNNKQRAFRAKKLTRLRAHMLRAPTAEALQRELVGFERPQKGRRGVGFARHCKQPYRGGDLLARVVVVVAIILVCVPVQLQQAPVALKGSTDDAEGKVDAQMATHHAIPGDEGGREVETSDK